MNEKIDSETLNELIGLGERLSEDRLYEIVIDEVERNEFDNVAKAKALEEAEGDQNKARAFYTKHRVRRLRDLIAEEKIAAEAERVRAKEKEAQAESERQEAEKREKQLQEDAKDAAIKEDNRRFSGIMLYGIIGAVILYWLLF